MFLGVTDDKVRCMDRQRKDQVIGALIAIIPSLLAGGLLAPYLGSVFNPPRIPDVVSEISWNSGPVASGYETPFRLDLTPDPEPWIGISATNRGNELAESFEVALKLLSDNDIVDVHDKYTPFTLENRREKREVKQRQFLERITSLPCRGSVQYKVIVRKFVRSEQEFASSISSKGAIWTPKTMVRPKYSSTREQSPCALSKWPAVQPSSTEH